MEAGYATRWLPGQGLPNALRITIGPEAQTRDVARLLRDMAEAGRRCCLFPASRPLAWVLSAPSRRARSKRSCPPCGGTAIAPAERCAPPASTSVFANVVHATPP